MYISAQLPSTPGPAPSATGTERRLARADPLLGITTGSRYTSSSSLHAAPDVHVSVASQIGCLHNCTYCVSSRLGGLRRNLGLEEMLAQVLYFGSAAAFRPDGPGLPDSTNFVSTVGILPALERLLNEFPGTAVTWTLNTPFPAQRAKLMPTVEAQHPLTFVLDLLRTHVRDHARDNVAVAYLLLRGVNDSDAHLRALTDLVANGPVPVSLVHFHPVLVPAPAEAVPRPRARRGAWTLAGFDPTGFFEPSLPHVVEAWRAKLQDAGIPVAVQEYFEFPAIATGPPLLAAGAAGSGC
ncbi:hypothetical protein AMAG_13678 [Allomyces macrogynus ATCC 38327]|uniref:Radical SAM core domain-containing protein n=1 Tax=Allomyces macrogynus (strain ATCC 38327) TaxID=578462 RepID=A0A0L0T406_ALLM3|nr:hypothetical protein AMAG_13678 [Allomyces macrogynus ATCC 38327]|eukprot:KNE69299.1 hypothetical protein AMAG_13678 [Allomyces macrogynus ATCC 38327]